MVRPVLPLLLVVPLLQACAAAAPPEEVGPPLLVAPTPIAGAEALVLRRCDDGGDGGVLIDGICL